MKNGRIRQIGAISLSLMLSFLAIACDGSGLPQDPVPDPNDELPIQQPDGNVNDNTNNNVNDNSDNNSNENTNNNTNDNASDENPPPEPAAPSPIGEWIVESGHLLPIAATVDFPGAHFEGGWNWQPRWAR
ncbi:MAG: hypothetical protein IPK83_07965 [Planctomycetes bacterium]|nr:hypothetical protein [Planctomycetota bacterium]